MTRTVRSRDGTAIAYERTGNGPPLILIDGALSYRGASLNGALAEQLADRFTVFTYDRRGRGESGDTAPYAVEREIEDLDALIEAAGGSAALYGISSGGALALEAAMRIGDKITKIAVYEIPFVVDDSRPPAPERFRERLQELVAGRRRGAAVKSFMRDGVRVPAVFLALMPLMPAWRKLKAVAHTLPYDLAIMGDTQRGRSLPADRWAAVTTPVLAIGGGKSPQWLHHAVAQLASVLPNARERMLEGQTHIVKAKALAPVLADYLKPEAGTRARTAGS